MCFKWDKHQNKNCYVQLLDQVVREYYLNVYKKTEYGLPVLSIN